MTAAVIATYAAFSRIAVAHARRERGELYGRVAFFAVILGVFSSPRGVSSLVCAGDNLFFICT